jgi:hypothetical protein
MNLNLDFKGISETSAVSKSNALKPWDIYDVTFDGLEQVTMKGKKDPEATYNTIKLSFSGDKGRFSTNLFVPSTQEDITRKVITNKDGHEYEMPSRFEEFKWTLLQVAAVVNPSGYEKLKVQAAKIKTMEDFIKLVLTVANAKKGAKTKLKLTGRNNNGTVYAQIPNVCGISKEGNCYVRNNFIGDNVEFSDYEARQAAAYKTAKPTAMSAIASPSDNMVVPEVTPADTSDIDFESIL